MNTKYNNDSNASSGNGPFVIYSSAESAVHEEPMFWSNTRGWGDLGGATQFSPEERSQMSLPVSIGSDAEWLSYSAALVKDRDIPIAALDPSLVTITLPALEVIALRVCITHFVRTERAKGRLGLGKDFIEGLTPVRRQLLAGHRELRMTLLDFALVHEALRRDEFARQDAELRVDVYKRAISSLRRRFMARSEALRTDHSLNVYTHDFQSRCPANDETICYRVVISSTTMIRVEEIVALAAAHPVSYHEALADAFYKAFGGSQRMSAFHHGVHIKTIRTDDNPH